MECTLEVTLVITTLERAVNFWDETSRQLLVLESFIACLGLFYLVSWHALVCDTDAIKHVLHIIERLTFSKL